MLRHSSYLNPLTAWCKVFVQKQIVSQLIKKYRLRLFDNRMTYSCVYRSSDLNDYSSNSQTLFIWHPFLKLSSCLLNVSSTKPPFWAISGIPIISFSKIHFYVIFSFRSLSFQKKNCEKGFGRGEIRQVCPSPLGFPEAGCGTFLRTRAQFVYKFGRNSSACPWYFWRGK